MTLTEFLLARIAEDEAVAQTATPGPWVADGSVRGDCVVWGPGRNDPTGKFILNTEAEPHWTHSRSVAFDADQADVAHIARHDPARVMAECEAKRRSVEEAWYEQHRIEGEWGSGQSREQMDAKDDVPGVVAALAAVYADHPDYREEWRP